MASLYLGLDSSTQSMTGMVIDLDRRAVAFEETIAFDSTFPEFQTRNGVLQDADPKVVHAPPLMWVEALDRLFEVMRAAGVPLGDIRAVSGAGQQHGSVYLNDSAPRALKHLGTANALAEGLKDIFSRRTSPIWMDSSTSSECREIAEELGGRKSTAEATGSTTFERFTGPQIRKFYKSDFEGYDRTAHIGLVSSFMASVLTGRIAPIDHGDGAGMNLMDIQSLSWHPAALDATGPDLRGRLPDLADPWDTVGEISPYFVRRYGFDPGTRIGVWSGDNPCSVIGLGLVRPGMVAISLGTSDTFFGTMANCRTDPRGEGHVFVSPTGDYMTLICFRNGSLARERVRDAYGLNWDGFSQALQSTPAGNDGKIMLPYFEPEFVPNVLEPGARRFDLDEADTAGNCRAVVEAQMMSMRIHSAWMEVSPTAIYATGGASANPEILEVMANVQGCPVHRFEGTNSAVLGAAIRAAYTDLRARGEDPGWDSLVSELAAPVPGTEIHPSADTQAVYSELAEKYAACEGQVLGSQTRGAR